MNRRKVLGLLATVPFAFAELRAAASFKDDPRYEGYWVQRWEGKTVTILNYGREKEVFQETVKEFQKYMSGTKLKVKNLEVLPCESTPPAKAGELIVCDTEGLGYGYTHGADGKISTAIMTIGSKHKVPMITCHELLHALTGIADDYEVRALSPRDSCVHGWNDHLGEWDKGLLRFVYPKKPAKGKKRNSQRAQGERGR